MASKEDKGGCVTLSWKVQNIDIFRTLKESLSTPFWATEHTGKSVWRRLHICFKFSPIVVNISSAKGFLHLDSCELSLISPCMEVPLQISYRGSEYWSYTLERDTLFGDKRESIIPNDTLTLRCKMWKKTMKTQEFRINSVLHRFSYLWNIENFRSDTFYSTTFEKENVLLKALLTSKSEKATHTLILDEVSTIERHVSPIHCHVYDKDSDVRVLRKIFDKYYNTIYSIKICLISTSLKLQLESVFAVHNVCQDLFKLQSPPRYESVPEGDSSALGDDFLLLYKDKLFSDATLNAEGKSFRVHRNILSARSPVFLAMFEKDEMSEGRERVVDIDDVGSETVDRMLVYLYGDSLRSVQQWEEVSALYYAADKYDIQPLRHKCASSLKEGLSVDNVCEVLVLADRHSDDQLLKCIVDFIHQNEKVISSEKWDSFEDSHPLLSSKILRKIHGKNRKK